jgi:hypothetical protein
MTTRRKLIALSALLCSTSLLSGCNEPAPDASTQIGGKPDLQADRPAFEAVVTRGLGTSERS